MNNIQLGEDINDKELLRPGGQQTRFRLEQLFLRLSGDALLPGLFLCKRLFDLDNLVSLDHVADLDVVEVFDGNATFEPRPHFLDILLEAL